MTGVDTIARECLTMSVTMRSTLEAGHDPVPMVAIYGNDQWRMTVVGAITDVDDPFPWLGAVVPYCNADALVIGADRLIRTVPTEHVEGYLAYQRPSTDPEATEALWVTGWCWTAYGAAETASLVSLYSRADDGSLTWQEGRTGSPTVGPTAGAVQRALSAPRRSDLSGAMETARALGFAVVDARGRIHLPTP